MYGPSRLNNDVAAASTTLIHSSGTARLGRYTNHCESNISKTTRSVSSDIQTLRSGLKKFFKTNFEVSGYRMKH